MTPKLEIDSENQMNPPSEADELSKERSRASNASGKPASSAEELANTKENENEDKLVEVPTSPSETPKEASELKSKKRGRRKRGSSLEREISELIRQTGSEEAAEAAAAEDDVVTKACSADFILQDLVALDDLPEPQEGPAVLISIETVGVNEKPTEEIVEDVFDDVVSDVTEAEVLDEPEVTEAVVLEEQQAVEEPHEEVVAVEEDPASAKLVSEDEQPTAEDLEEDDDIAESVEEAVEPPSDTMDIHQDPSLTLAITQSEDELSIYMDEFEEQLSATLESKPKEVITHVSIPDNETNLNEIPAAKEKAFSDIESFDSISWKDGEAPRRDVTPVSPMDTTARQSPATTQPGTPQKKEPVLFKTKFEDWSSSNFDDTIDPAEFGATDFFANSVFDASKRKSAPSTTRLVEPRIQRLQYRPVQRIHYRPANSWRKAPPRSEEPASPDSVYAHPTNTTSTMDPPKKVSGSNRWNQRSEYPDLGENRAMF